ncbi:hypothetical protein RWV98_05510 [Agathobaculum sp. NTUH-O15-33]|uniref:hypothetical protein n=1 Tax=Agathobaculum sp. NTUH-O15-33 TaxID=3079302 RepID=UPI002958C2C2|nr:hypothetical protein [Agathobaculum sp. NTUH-O15-33]WNX85724.1 hypothetical protein RWV98_05510 [Agathobaculum sp. NTUH-O15-33]
MRKAIIPALCLVLCFCSACSSSQTLQDKYDEGYDTGYSEGAYNASHDLSVDDISDELAGEIAHEWIMDHQSELIDTYGYIFAESDRGIDLYNAEQDMLFLSDNIGFITNEGNRYHRFDCSYFNMETEWFAHNVEYCQYLGYSPCEHCNMR